MRNAGQQAQMPEVTQHPRTMGEPADALTEALRHGRELLRAELALAKVEFKAELGDAWLGLCVLVLGVVLAASGLVATFAALVIALKLEAWTIVGLSAALASLGALIGWWGSRKLAVPRLGRTRRTLARSAAVLQEVKRDGT